MNLPKKGNPWTKNPLIVLIILLAYCAVITGQTSAMDNSAERQQSGSGNSVFLPLVASYSPTQVSDQFNVRVNMPYFSGDAGDHFSEAAIFWFGKVTPSENYGEIRFAYDDDKIWVYLSTFDQYLWYTTNPSASPLTSWDSATLQIDLDGNLGSTPDGNSYKVDAAMSWFESRAPYQAAYRWQSGQWVKSNLAVTTERGYDGFFNDNVQGTRGWALTFIVPFSSLGLSSRPADGTIWGISMTMHDRDSQGGPPLADKSWPDGLQANVPSTWAQVRFGLPDYGAIAGTVTGSDLIRRDSQRGINVPDSGLGGTTPNLCPGDTNYIFNTWGNANNGSHPDFNIQNQSKITDWPCYSKYYVTFPLTTIPANKTILSARLILHQQGGAGDPGQATPSLIQVFTIAGDWSENTIAWNNAPAPTENVSRAWVDVPTNYGDWPKVARYWDVTMAASRAYQNGQPLRLALYEADSDYHSGKYFTSSDSGDWNIAGRPSLEITWGN